MGPSVLGGRQTIHPNNSGRDGRENLLGTIEINEVTVAAQEHKSLRRLARHHHAQSFRRLKVQRLLYRTDHLSGAQLLQDSGALLLPFLLRNPHALLVSHDVG